MRKGNLSYTRLTKLVAELVSAGLLIGMSEHKGSRYRISEKGMSFLHGYNEFEDFAQSFGLHL